MNARLTAFLVFRRHPEPTAQTRGACALWETESENRERLFEAKRRSQPDFFLQELQSFQVHQVCEIFGMHDPLTKKLLLAVFHLCLALLTVCDEV